MTYEPALMVHDMIGNRSSLSMHVGGSSGAKCSQISCLANMTMKFINLINIMSAIFLLRTT